MGEWKVDISRGRHSFSFVYRIRLLWEDEAEWFVWHSKATVAQREPVWTGINYQSVYRRGGKITKAIQVVLTNNLRDPFNECTRTNAFGFDTGHCWNSDYRVHLISRLVLFMSAQSSHIISGPRCHFSRIKPLTGSCTGNYVLVSSHVALTLSTNHTFRNICSHKATLCIYTCYNNAIIAPISRKQSRQQSNENHTVDARSWTRHLKINIALQVQPALYRPAIINHLESI